RKLVVGIAHGIGRGLNHGRGVKVGIARVVPQHLQSVWNRHSPEKLRSNPVMNQTKRNPVGDVRTSRRGHNLSLAKAGRPIRRFVSPEESSARLPTLLLMRILGLDVLIPGLQSFRSERYG